MLKGGDLRAIWSNLDLKVCFCSWGLKIGRRASEQSAARCPGEAAKGTAGGQRVQAVPPPPTFVDSEPRLLTCELEQLVAPDSHRCVCADFLPPSWTPSPTWPAWPPRVCLRLPGKQGGLDSDSNPSLKGRKFLRRAWNSCVEG